MASEVAPKQDDPESDNLRTDYEQTNEQIRMLTDIRFKLLTLIPSGTIIAVSVLGTTASMETALVVGILGFIFVFALAMYEQRNSQIYDAYLQRAAQIENRLRLLNGGLYKNRPKRSVKLLGILVWHDRALAFIYGTVLGGWFYLITYSLLNLLLGKVNVVFYLVSLLISALVACAFIWHFHQIEAVRNRKLTIILIRHGKKDEVLYPDNKDDDKRPLSAEGRKEISSLQCLLADHNLDPEIYLTSQFAHAKETAYLLAGKKPVYSVKVLASPTPTTKEHIFQAFINEVEREAGKKLELDRKATIAIVGHDPGLYNILKALTSSNGKRIAWGEAIWVRANRFCDFLVGKGAIYSLMSEDNRSGQVMPESGS